MAMNYTTLKARIASVLNKTNLTTVIPDFIEQGEAILFRRIKSVRQFDYLDFDIDDEMSGVPAGFVTAESFTLTATGERLEYAQPDTFDALTPMTGKPRFYTISGNLFVFAPTPDQTYEARLRYRARPSGLSATVSSNWILERHPDAYIYAALAESAPYLRDDDRLPMWEARRDRAIAEINDAEPRRATSLRMDDMPVRYAAFDIVRG